MAIDPSLLRAFLQQAAPEPQAQGPYIPSFASDPARGLRHPDHMDPSAQNNAAYTYVKPHVEVPDPSADFASTFGYDKAKTDVTLPGPPSSAR